MLKSRSATQNWRVWHHKLAADGSKRLLLDATNGSEDASFLNDTAPTSTVFTLGNADDAWNTNGDNYIVYCWHEVPGFSKFGSYTGNGSSDGPYVNLEFRPAWVMIKKISGDGLNNWEVRDVKRNPFNPVDNRLFPNTTDADGNEKDIDFVSNGFKIKTTASGCNTSGSDYIYMAFAEEPGGTIFGLDANAR
jgi:hypothetical protein